MPGYSFSNVRVKIIQRKLSKIFHLVPWIKHLSLLVCAWKCQLYTYIAINWTPMVPTLEVWHRTDCVVDTNRCFPWTRIASQALPIQVLECTLLKFKNLWNNRILLQLKNKDSKKKKKKIAYANVFTKVILVTVWVLSATNVGADLAAYFRPANATTYPPDKIWFEKKKNKERW